MAFAFDKGVNLLYTATSSGDVHLRSQSLPGPSILIIFFSGLTRSLVSSDYNLHVNECKTAAWNMLAYKGPAFEETDGDFPAWLNGQCTPRGAVKDLILAIETGKTLYLTMHTALHAWVMSGHRYDIGDVASYKRINEQLNQ